MSKFIDIHSHNYNTNENEIKIHVIDNFSMITENIFCYGIHPWHIDKYNIDSVIDNLNEIKNNKNFIALGEIGLDKSYPSEFNKQKEYFRRQISFAVINNIDWIVIHCVKAFNEVYVILVEMNYKGSILFHGFNSSIEMVKQFSIFDCYYSFGHLLITNNKNQKLFKKIRIEQIFLETDDQSTYSIQDIYKKAASIRSVPITELKDRLEQKFKKLFIEPNSKVI
jgi:TatD DNase family protein